MTKDLRVAALRRFAVAITALNVLGHTVLGFEQSLAQLVACVLTAYAMELLLETLESWAERRRPRYAGGGPVRAIDFMLAPHITGLAVAMLLYPNARILPVMFGAAVAIASKFLLRAPVNGGMRHFLNPSNFGITVTLVVFPWLAISPPYHFTAHVRGIGDWILPAIIITTGTLLNARFTKRIPLILGWVGGFVVQALLRGTFTDTPAISPLAAMTGVAFILFTFYMVTDPATTPSAPRAQFVFGSSVALVYGLLVANHVVFGFFFALTAVTFARGALLWLEAFAKRTALSPAVAEGDRAMPIPLGGTEA